VSLVSIVIDQVVRVLGGVQRRRVELDLQVETVNDYHDKEEKVEDTPVVNLKFLLGLD
jgi:hypothetical protein